MKLPDLDSWDDRDHVAKLLGFYGAELHTVICHTLTKSYDCLVNIGRGDRRRKYLLTTHHQTRRSFAEFDRRKRRRFGKVKIGSTIDAFMLQTVLSKWKNPPLLIDCEGCEFHLMQPDLVLALKNVAFIVECHNFIHPNVAGVLVGRFRETHQIKLISEGPPNPNCSTFLRNRHGLIRWLAVSENRPETVEWLWGTPLVGYVSH